jgi:DNA-binding transcriptional LysR family regulator
LSEFVAVVARGSISAGARALGLPRSTVSRRISALEAELGVRLLHRSTRRLVLTPAGQELNRRARRIEADAAEAWGAVRRLDDTPRGLLRISTSGSMLNRLIVDFAVELPEVRLEVLETMRQVDLVGEGIDVAIRFGPVRNPNLIVRRVASVRRVVVGSAAYFERHGVPGSPDDLSQHACLVGFAGDETAVGTWPLADGGTVAVSGPVAGSSRDMLRMAALAGLGLAFIPWMVVRNELDSGALLPVLEDTVVASTAVSVVFADREYIDPKVRAFVDRAVPFLERIFRGGS